MAKNVQPKDRKGTLTGKKPYTIIADDARFVYTH